MKLLDKIKAYYGDDAWQIDMAMGGLAAFCIACAGLIWWVG